MSKERHYPKPFEARLAACGLLEPVVDALRARRSYVDVHKEFRLEEDHGIPYSTFAAFAKEVKDEQRMEELKLRTELRRNRERIEALTLLHRALAGDGEDESELDAADLINNQILMELSGEDVSAKTIKLLAGAVKDLRQAEITREKWEAEKLQKIKTTVEEMAARPEAHGKVDKGEVIAAIDQVMRGEEVTRG